MKHYIYQTRNLLNGKYYIGKHSSEDIEHDKYLGSGKYLNNAIKKYGIQNFIRTILFQFQTEIEAWQKQSQIVNQEFISRKDTYNVVLGGAGFNSNFVIGRNSTGKTCRIRIDDPRYLSGEIVGANTGTVTVRDKDNNYLKVSTTDPRYLSGELKHNCKGRPSGRHNKVAVTEQDGSCMLIDLDDPRYLSGELTVVNKGAITVRDKDGNCFNVDSSDPRWLSGQLISIHKNLVSVQIRPGENIKIQKDDPRWLSGQLKSPMVGKFLAKNEKGETYIITRDDPRWLSGQLVGYRSKKKGALTHDNKS